MFEKLELHHVVRYLFSGIMILIGVLLARDVSWQEVTVWWAENEWARDAGPTTAFLLLVFLLGFLSFSIYRGFVYEIGILSIKALAGRLFKRYSYRKYLVDILATETQQPLSELKAERVYALLKVTRLKDFYQITASPITTSLHFLYFCSLVMLGSALFHPIRHISYVLASLAAFGLFLYMDWHFEELELLLFKDEADVVRATLRELAERGLFGPLPAKTHPPSAVPNGPATSR